MKKTVKISLAIIVALLIAAFAYWEYNKKKIVRDAVEDAVLKKTDSIYFIHYDSSIVDAATGSARFFNVTLQSDSLQRELMLHDSTSTSTIYNIRVGEVSIAGTDIPSLLTNTRIDANTIKIINPVIRIIESGSKKEKQFNQVDTLELYEKILGKFNSIHAGEIVIENGQLTVARKTDMPYVSLEGINITVRNVLINSDKNYDNIISYFIKDILVKVKQANIRDEANSSLLLFSGIQYDAAKKSIGVENFKQFDLDSNKVAFDINNTVIKGLNTDSFILRKQLKADELTSDGGLMTFYNNKKDESSGNDNIEISNNFFNQAQLNSIVLNNTKVIVYNRVRANDPPFILTDVKFSASDIQRLYSGTSIKNLVGRSNWNLSAGSFSMIAKNRKYKLSVGPFKTSSALGTIHIDYFTVKPLMSEAAFVKGLKEEDDLYDIAIKNIDLSGVDIKRLITERVFFAKNAAFNLVLKISRDRMVPDYTGSRVGNYPHQLIQKIKFPVYIKKILAKDSYITYTERSDQTQKKGTIFFSNVNGTIENFTNIKTYIKEKNELTVTAQGKLLDVQQLKTEWHLPLNTTNGAFAISGEGGPFNAEALNPLVEPLALASFKKGEIKSIAFSMNGNDDETKGKLVLLYNDLKIEALKKDSNDLKKRALISFVANLIVKDNNPSNDKTRETEIDMKRDTTRSFFNLIWQGIFKAAKRTALGKDDDK